MKRSSMKNRLRPLLLTAVSLTVAVAASACGPANEGAVSAKPTAAGAEPSTGRPTTPQASASSPTRSPATASPSPTPARTTSTPTPKQAIVKNTAAPRTRTAWPRVTFARLTFEIPPGWTLTTYGNGSDACVQPVHRAGLPTMFGCAGIAIKSGSIAGNELQSYEAGQSGGWYAATDVQPCPVRPTFADGSFNGITSGTSSPPVESGLRPVGSRKAAYDRWTAACASGYRFSPQAWHLPVSRVLFLDCTGHAETARVLESVRFPG
ncbi:hypothetical protein ACFY20_26190 [Streptomyces sp. NPDC001312]|uniref:hypothetical protein n=1 Tax=Streptomyces sp. NPDC001312 TaxID=3364561 RepID=UPI0036B4EB4E